MNPSTPSEKSLSPWKKAGFGAAVAGVLLGGVELALGLLGVRPAWEKEDPYVGFSRHIPHFVSEPGTDGGAVMVVAPSKREIMNPVRFAARKPEGTYRIVCVGDSTVYGRPFFGATSFPGWLAAILPAMQPERSWEVINAGAIGYASYRIAGVMEELAGYQPDLFVVYAGHNEFLERRTYAGLSETHSWITGTASLANRTRLATAIREVFDRAGVRRVRSAHRAPVLGEELRAIPIDAVGPEAYHRDEAFRVGVRDHYRASLERMIRIAREARAELLVVVPASNLSGFAPFKSEHREGLGASELAEWAVLESDARKRVEAGQYEQALPLIRKAQGIDSRYAALWYLEGQCLAGLGRQESAAEAFRRARDEDICPLRLPEDLLGTLRQVAEGRGVSRVDFAALLEAMSPEGVPGRRFFHDHVHPTVEANRHLALAIATNLVQRGVVQPSPGWGETALEGVITSVNRRVDRALHGEQLRVLATMLVWLGQPDFAREQALLSLEYSGATHEVLMDLAARMRARGALPLAIEFLEQAVRVTPDSRPARYALALCRGENGQPAEAVAELRSLLKRDPGDGEAWLSLGTLLEAQGDRSGAEQSYREAIRAAPGAAPAHARLGQNLARQDRVDEAIGSFRQAAELEPRSGPAQYNLGLAYEKAGQWAEARRHYLESLRLALGRPEVEQRLRGLDVVERSGGTRVGEQAR